MARNMRVGFSAAYVAAIHILVALLLYKSDAIVLIEKNLGFATPKSVYFHREMTEYQDRLDATLSPGSVIFLGASHTQSLDVAAITDHAVNYGIGGDAIADVMERLPNYHSLNQARAIVLEVGYNDLRYHSLPKIAADYRRLLAALPDNTPLVLSSILPIDETAPEFLRWPGRTNNNIVKLNQAMVGLCKERPRCFFADADPLLRDRNSRLAAEFHRADGVHLTPAGYRIWSRALALALHHAAQPNIVEGK